MKAPKIPTVERALLLAKSKDRARRFFDAHKEYMKTTDAMGCESAIVDCPYSKVHSDVMKKFSLPDNLLIDSEECADDKDTLELTQSVLKKIILQKCEFEDVEKLVFHCEELDEIDLGWVYFERPQGYFDLRPDPFWVGRKLLDVLLVVAGLSESDDVEPILYALQNPPSAAKRTSISSAMDAINTGSDPMDAIRDILGDQLHEAF